MEFNEIYTEPRALWMYAQIITTFNFFFLIINYIILSITRTMNAEIETGQRETMKLFLFHLPHTSHIIFMCIECFAKRDVTQCTHIYA